MTPQEVIDILKMFTTDKFQRCTSSEFDDAIYTAIEALEKQVPKKPIKLTCPTCGFDRIDNSWWVFTYCPKCGQLLDWGGIE